MKKSALLALACAAVMSTQAFAQQTPEITYQEDPSQGYLFNRFKSNWFLGVEGGVNYQFSKNDNARKWSDRFAPEAAIIFGKWFSPIMGARASVNYMGLKGVSKDPACFGKVYEDGAIDTYDNGKYYKTFVYNFGGTLDMMINVTNWWCGYKPNRVYNFIAYAGGGAYWGLQQKDEDTKYFSSKKDITLGLRAGIINSFNVSKQVALALDIRYTALGANRDNNGFNSYNSNLGASLSVTYLFNNRTWSAPIVPIIPEIPNCDEYKAQLAEADAKIASLQKQLNDCLNRPVEKAAPCPAAPLATVYFPIGSSRLNRVDSNVLKSVANEIKANPDTKYDVIGWADTWTGSDAVNARLRTNRANTVVKQLVRNGVDEAQLNAKSGEGNRIDNRDQIYLDRAVTIEAVK